ncbi:hypothetical protein VTO42DRAFT_4526 [Malbranchea cinnamomea]
MENMSLVNALVAKRRLQSSGLKSSHCCEKGMSTKSKTMVSFVCYDRNHGLSHLPRPFKGRENILLSHLYPSNIGIHGSHYKVHKTCQIASHWEQQKEF